MDWSKMKDHIAQAHKPFKCSCGGTFQVCGQALCVGKQGAFDLMTYKCSECKKEVQQSFDVPYLNKLKEESNDQK